MSLCLAHRLGWILPGEKGKCFPTSNVLWHQRCYHEGSVVGEAKPIHHFKWGLWRKSRWFSTSKIHPWPSAWTSYDTGLKVSVWAQICNYKAIYQKNKGSTNLIEEVLQQIIQIMFLRERNKDWGRVREVEEVSLVHFLQVQVLRSIVDLGTQIILKRLFSLQLWMKTRIESRMVTVSLGTCLFQLFTVSLKMSSSSSWL